MRIITWNILNKNEKIKSSLGFIFKYKPDIICLQEFPEKSLPLLNQKEYHFVNASDCNTIVFNKKNQTNSLLVVGIKRKIKYNTEKISLKMPANNIIKRVTNLKESIEGLKVTIPHKGEDIVLFNCHLSFAARPSIRKKQLKKILKSGEGNRIICGDFNDFGNHLFSWFIGFLFNYRSKDYKVDEKRNFENIFRRHNLKNLFHGKVTHPILRQQLDHILVSKKIKVEKNQVIKNGIKYSDHYPLLVDLNLN